MIASRRNLINYTKNSQSICSIYKRLKSKKTLKGKVGEYTYCHRALSHFDDFYGAVFQKAWPSVRLGLLSRQKQLAIINNFGDIKEAEEFLQNQGSLEIRSILNILKKNFQNSETTVKPKEKNHLDDIILNQKELEQEKALGKIFPRDKELQSKHTYLDSNDKNDVKENMAVYDPEEPKTSLLSDLSAAQIDSRRLILPDSKGENSILHDFIPTTQLRGLEGFIPEANYYKYYQSKSEMPVNIEDELDLNFPASLKVYTFDRGDMSEFLEPLKSAHGVYNYLTVDGGDLLTALALGVQQKDKVLDLCSPSGNIAFCIFQTLPQYLVCLDSENKNTEKIFREYLFDYSPSWNDILFVTSKDFINDDDRNLFDKILVDVPCTEDKLSVFEEEENIFNPKLIKKRLGLPGFQSLLLIKALKLVKPGGTVVYSTRTLSPVQNDGVVNEALKVVWQETKMECTIRNLAPALGHMSEYFHFADYLPMKFGTLIVPFIPINFGPRYFCKIIKNE